MQRLRLATVGMVVLGILGATSLSACGDKESNAQEASAESNGSAKAGKVEYGEKKACDYLTQEIADAILSPGSQLGVRPSGVPEPSPLSWMSISTCVYFEHFPEGGTVAERFERSKTTKKAEFSVHSPLNESGARACAAEFREMEPSVKPLKGLGQKAFWDPESQELHVLEKGASLTFRVSFQTSTDVNKQGEAEAQALARKVLANY